MTHSAPFHLFVKLKQLATGKSVLHIGAHPDDEEIGLLSYFSFKHYARTIYWSATRGEGGQNRINSYAGKALGIYRTWESLYARQEDGAECLFGPFIDFGFSKNAQETFAKWGKKRVVRELVRAVRLVQPQVVISRWEGTPGDGHGQHQATAQALYQAIEEAADPDLRLHGLFPWRTPKFYLSANKTIYPTGEPDLKLEKTGFLKINTGEYSPLLGCTYQEQAWSAYGSHRTQGLTVLPAPGDFYYYLKNISNPLQPESDFFEPLETGLPGIFSGISSVPDTVLRLLHKIQSLTEEAVSDYSPEQPAKSAPLLFEALHRMKSIRTGLTGETCSENEKLAMFQAMERKIRAFEEAIALCLGLRLESICTRARVTPGESVWITNRLWKSTGAEVDRTSFQLTVPDDWTAEKIEDPEILEEVSPSMAVYEVFIDSGAELSSAYWLKTPANGSVYECPDDAFQCLPFGPALLTARCTVSAGGQEIAVTSPALHRKSFPGGHRSLPLMVVPPISLHPEFDRKICTVSDSPQTFSLKVTARSNDEERPATGTLQLENRQGWNISPDSVYISLPKINEAATSEFEITLPAGTPEGKYQLCYTIRCRGRDYSVVLTPVRMGAPGLPDPENPGTCIKEEFIVSPARVDICLVHARLREGQTCGYIRGAKEETLSVLQSVGVNIAPLDDAFIAHGNLSAYDSIVIGPNAYLLRAHLAENSHRFQEYVENGGTLIVQYHTFDYQGQGFAPYPFSYSRPHDRVTDETAEMTILEPDHPIFSFPNPIVPDDFNNWVHDRGLYFFGAYDSRYQPLLSCADPGEPQKTGGLVTCRYGKGIYLYTGYSLYRQLPAGVPGAFRLFFNMLSLKSHLGKKT